MNVSLTVWNRHDHHSTNFTVMVVYLVFECLIGVASVCTNSKVLLAMLKEPKLRTITNCFVGSLAAADVLVRIMDTPIAILTTLGLPKNFTLCVLMNCVYVQVALVSVLNLLGVALDRFCAICMPFHYRNVMSEARARLLVGIIWLVGIFVGLIPLFVWRKGEHTLQYCSFEEVISLEYMVYLILFAFTLPSFIVMVMCYVYIFRLVRSTKQTILQVMVLHGRERTKKTILNNSRGDKGILMVIFFFMICWMPFHVVKCMLLWVGTHSVLLDVYLVGNAFSNLNSVVNPLLFAFGNSQFKVTIKSILCGASTTIEWKGVRSEPHSVEADRPMPFVRHLLVLGVSITLTSNSTESVAFFENIAEDIRQHPFLGPNRDRKKTTCTIAPHTSLNSISSSTTCYLHSNGTEFLAVSETVAQDIREQSSGPTPEHRPPTSIVPPPPPLDTTSQSTTCYLHSNGKEFLAVSETVAQDIREHQSSGPTPEHRPPTSIVPPPPLLNTTRQSTTRHLTSNGTESVAVSEAVVKSIHEHPSSKPTPELKPTTSIASPPPSLNNTSRSTTIVTAVASVPNDVENA